MAAETPETPEEVLDVGMVVRDTKRDRIGRVMECGPCRVHLRPVCGGREWEVARDDIEQLPISEALGRVVAERNAQSRWGQRWRG
jgi:hypothetical protein